MIYTSEEKAKLDLVVAAFADYIAKHTYFDIAYTDKIGYVCLLVDETQEDEAVRIRTAEQMFCLLLEEMILDVVMERKVTTTSEAQEESARRISPYLEKLGSHKEQAEGYMKVYFEKHIWKNDHEEL